MEKITLINEFSDIDVCRNCDVCTHIETISEYETEFGSVMGLCNDCTQEYEIKKEQY